MKIVALTCLSVLCLGLLPGRIVAEQSEEQTEQEKEAAREAEENAAKAAKPNDSYASESTVKGKVIIFPQPQEEEVPGAFNVGSKIYLLKVREEALKKEIIALNGKTVALAGKVRNDGKYFVVEGIPKAEPKPPRMDNPAGL
jgi:hypothetical protein